MSDLFGNQSCWFSHAKAQMSDETLSNDLSYLYMCNVLMQTNIVHVFIFVCYYK